MAKNNGTEKAQKGEIVPTSPAEVSIMSFDDDIKDYKSILAAQNETEKTIEEKKKEITNFLQEHHSNYRYDQEGYAMNDLKVYKTNKKPTFSADVEELRKNYGSEFNYMINTEKYLSILKRHIGKNGINFLEEVSDAFKRLSNFSERTLDEEATTKAKGELKKLFDELKALELKVDNLQKRKAAAKEYVSYVKDIASIASVAKKENK